MGVFANPWGRWRNRLLANPRFRRRVQRIPGLRGLARRRAGDLFETTAAFVNSQVLAACLELELLERLEPVPAALSELSESLDISPDRLSRLLESAAALGLVEPRPGKRWGLGAQGAVLRSDPGLKAMSLHHHALYADLADPVSLLRGERRATRLGELWPYAETSDPGALDEQATRRYTELMADSQRMIAEQVIDAFDFSGHDALLDVGGGSGAFLEAVGTAHPHLDLALFDLPGVVPWARERFARGPVAGRVTILGGDFHRDPLPSGFDLVSLVRIAHDHDDEPLRRLLRRIHEALPPGGTLLLAEPMPGRNREDRTLGNYFRFYLMAMGSGRPRTARTLKGLLKEAGFERIRRHRTAIPLICGLISGRRAGQAGAADEA